MAATRRPCAPLEREVGFLEAKSGPPWRQCALLERECDFEAKWGTPRRQCAPLES